MFPVQSWARSLLRMSAYLNHLMLACLSTMTESHLFGLRGLLFWARVWIESEGRCTARTRLIHHCFLGIICSNVAARISRRFSDSFRLELMLVGHSSRHAGHGCGARRSSEILSGEQLLGSAEAELSGERHSSMQPRLFQPRNCDVVVVAVDVWRLVWWARQKKRSVGVQGQEIQRCAEMRVGLLVAR